MRQLSENVYQLTQPFRYAIYLASHDRLAEAFRLESRRRDRHHAQDRACGYGDWGIAGRGQDGIDTGCALLQQATDRGAGQFHRASALRPLVMTYKSQPEQAVARLQKALSLLASDSWAMT